MRLLMAKKENHSRSVPCVALSLAASKWLCELEEIVLGLKYRTMAKVKTIGLVLCYSCGAPRLILWLSIIVARRVRLLQ